MKKLNIPRVAENRLYLVNSCKVVDPKRYPKDTPCVGYEERRELMAFLDKIKLKPGSLSARLIKLLLTIAEGDDTPDHYPDPIRAVLEVIDSRLERDTP